MAFQRATKRRAKLRLGLVGVSGSGKTYSALAIGCAIAGAEGGRVAVVDSEHGSASLYGSGKPFEFDVLELVDFSPEKYVDAIREAERAGYAVIVLDSISHAWMGKGGALELKDNASRRQGENSYTAWRHVTPLHNALIDAMLQSPCHVIATMRSKQEYVIEKDEKGKTSIRKIGMAPIQREGMEYEFTLVGDLDQDHVLTVTKTRCPVVADACVRKPGREFAETLLAWLNDIGTVPTTAAPVAAPAEEKVLTPGVDPPAMSGAKFEPLPPPEPKVEAAPAPLAPPDAVRLTWERLKEEQHGNGDTARFTWGEAVRVALGVDDPKQRPSSTWTTEELEKVKALIWPPPKAA